MFKTITLIAALFLSSQASADGFICSHSDEGLVVKVYNQISPLEGTRNAAVMVVSDSRVAYGRKTIARFTSIAGTLDNEGASYSAKVDLRRNDSKRKGEDFMATKLGYISQVHLDVSFQYNEPVRIFTEMPAILTIEKRDGEVLSYDLTCERYLKN